MTIKIIQPLGDKTYKIRYCHYCGKNYMREVDGGSKEFCADCCQYHPSICESCGEAIMIRPFHKHLCSVCLKK